MQAYVCCVPLTIEDISRLFLKNTYIVETINAKTGNFENDSPGFTVHL